LPECDVQGLIENKEYDFRVAAVNENGEGEWLQGDNSIVAKLPFDAPDAPGEPNVEEVGGDFVSLTWDKPRSDGGGRITGYIIEKKEASADNWTRCNQVPVAANIFNVPNLIEDREYEFRVFAVNEAGESKPSSATRKVKVKDPKAAKVPEFTHGLKKVQAVQGRTARFEVECIGQPPPEISWFKGSRELVESGKYEMSKEGDKYILEVHDVFGEDADEYSVRATNRGGSRTSRGELVIKSPPKINVPARFADGAIFDKGEDVVLKIPFTGYPKPTVKWIRDTEELRNSGRYNIEVGDRHAFLTIKKGDKADDGPYRLTLENDLGTDSAVIKIQVNDLPDPPRYVQVENIAHDSLLLTWKPPQNDGGSFITQYVVEKLEPSTGKWIRCATPRFTHAKIEGLSPGQDYQFRVSAENLYGRSEPCEPTGIIKTEDSAPRKPRKGEMYDELGRRIRGKYDGPKIDNYDKFHYDMWKGPKPQPVDIKTGSVYDYYDVYEELGSGAFGVVHRCVEKATGHNFVAKFVNTPLPVDKMTVRNEINVMNQLHHPKLLNLHDAFEDKHEMVLVMEFLSGGELFDRVAAEDYKMTESEVVNYIRQVCEGLKHMHEENIVHLDIKPENILCDTKKSTNVKLIDFGLASKLDPENIVKVTTATAEFAAPEIVDHDAVGFYSDMWAVGVLSYILLSGLSPFSGEDDVETLQNVRRCDWGFDSDGFKGISEVGKDFIKKLLIKQPGRRMTVHEALDHSWLKGDHDFNTRIPSSRYNKIRERIKAKYADWPAPMPAIGRIANFSSIKKNRPKEHGIYDSYFDRREAIPRFIRKPHSQIVQEGNVANFKCKVVAASEPTITWYFNGIALNPSLKYMPKYSGKNYELRIGRCKINEDKGEYTVKAENSYGSREEVAFLNVEPAPDVPVRRAMSVEPTTTRRKRMFLDYDIPERPSDKAPKFTFPLRNRFLQAGVGVKLIATCDAKPQPKISWSKDGRDVRGGRYNTDYSLGICTLEITSCEVADSGRYVCTAENNKGEDSTECKVTVSEKVVIKPMGLIESSLDSSYSYSRSSRRTARGADDLDYSSSYISDYSSGGGGRRITRGAGDLEYSSSYTSDYSSGGGGRRISRGAGDSEYSSSYTSEYSSGGGGRRISRGAGDSGYSSSYTSEYSSGGGPSSSSYSSSYSSSHSSGGGGGGRTRRRTRRSQLVSEMSSSTLVS
jgi:serine/threonine protein kinase